MSLKQTHELDCTELDGGLTREQLIQTDSWESCPERTFKYSSAAMSTAVS